jgi:hypothetical protein
MKLQQSEVDTLSALHAQLSEVVPQLKTIDLQVDEERANRGFTNQLQDDVREIHNSLCGAIITIQKWIEIGA